MALIDIRRAIGSDDLTAIHDLLTTVAEADGRQALSDHLALDLASGGGDGFAAVLLRSKDRAGLIAYAQRSPANDGFVVELVVHPDHRGDLTTIGPRVLGATLETVAADGGGQVTWWVHDPSPVHLQIARGAHMEAGRRLDQMRRPLPTDEEVTIETRDYVIGDDDEEWLRVNNRAFADHGEQGGWTLDTLRLRQAEDWFDPAGFRVHDRDGRMAGFCWTKIHPAESPAVGPLGEIYVIAVDPDFHGLGLGRQLTSAGLEWLAGRGIGTALLYVDADNVAARTLYEHLGFQVHSTSTAFTAVIDAHH